MARILSGGFKGLSQTPVRSEQPYSIESAEIPDNTDDTLLGLALKTAAPGLPQNVSNKLQSLFAQHPVTEEVQRTALRTGARAGEALLGGAGSIGQAALGAANYLSGGATPSYEKAREKLPILPPTIENIREKQEKVTGEYLKPKNYIEEVGDNLTQLVTALAFPTLGVGGLTSGAKVGESISRIPKAAKIASTAIGGSELTKYLTGSELAGEATKFGIILGSGLPGGRKALENQAKKAYDIVDEIPDTITHQVPKLQSSLRKLWKNTETGHLTEDKKALQEFLASVDKSLEKGTKHSFKGGKHAVKTAMPIKEMAQLEKDANSLIRDRRFPAKARPNLIQLRDEFSEALNEYGQTNKPWDKAYQESKELWHGLKSRSAINDFLHKNADISEIMESKLAKGILFPGTLASGWLFPGKTAIGLGSLGAAYGIKKATELAEFLYKSPTARKYYWNATEAALKDNKNAFIQSARKLDHEAQKYEEENLDIEEQERPSMRARIISGGFKKS